MHKFNSPAPIDTVRPCPIGEWIQMSCKSMHCLWMKTNRMNGRMPQEMRKYHLQMRFTERKFCPLELLLMSSCINFGFICFDECSGWCEHCSLPFSNRSHLVCRHTNWLYYVITDSYTQLLSFPLVNFSSWAKHYINHFRGRVCSLSTIFFSVLCCSTLRKATSNENHYQWIQRLASSWY